MRVFIDADACPVTRQAVSLARQRGVPVTLVCDFAHQYDLDVQTVVVEKGADSADFALLRRLKAGDLVVTQDYGLVALCLAMGARAINQDGRIYTDGNITGLLTTRHEHFRARRAGRRLRGPKARDKSQDVRFERAFCALLDQMCLPEKEKTV